MIIPILRNMKHRSLRLLLILSAIISLTVCHYEVSAKNGADVRDKGFVNNVDSLMRKALGDSVSDIIINSDSVKVTSVSYDQSVANSTVALDRLISSVIKYSLCQPSMYKTDKKIYTTFEPWIIIDFYDTNAHISVLLDYVMNKWKVVDENETEISTYDMPKGALLLIMHTIFPDNKEIAEKIIEYTKEK